MADKSIKTKNKKKNIRPSLRNTRVIDKNEHFHEKVGDIKNNVLNIDDQKPVECPASGNPDIIINKLTGTTSAIATVDTIRLDAQQTEERVVIRINDDFNKDEKDKEAVTVKPCLSMLSNDQFIQEFPDDFFNRMSNEGPPTKQNDGANENYNSCNIAFVSFSDFDYSAECRNLERELLSECDHIIEDVEKEDHMHVY